MKNTLKINYTDVFETNGRYQVTAKNDRVKFWTNSIADIVDNLVDEKVISKYFKQSIEAKVAEQVGIDYNGIKEAFDELYYDSENQNAVEKIEREFNSMIINLPESLWKVALDELNSVRDLHINDHQTDWKNFLEMSVGDANDCYSFGVYDINTIDDVVAAELKARGIYSFITDVFFDNQELFEENDTIEYVIKTLADKVESFVTYSFILEGEIE
jgi:DNA-binding Lrp family transcriptional regulator